jgi:alpha-glucosidase
MTMGAFLPWYRNHYNGYTKAYQEPYNYSQYPYDPSQNDSTVLPACKKYIEIRYQLLQLFYDAMYECTQTNLPICRAMFLNDPQDPTFHPLDDVNGVLLSPYNPAQEFAYDTVNAYRVADQFFVGRDLLLAPVVLERWEYSSYGPGNNTNYYPSRPVYLPSGFDWYDFNGQFIPPWNSSSLGPTTLQGALNTPSGGGQAITWNTAQLDLVPAYIREGAIVPVRQLEQYVGELPINILTFNIYPGKDASYLCYQDDHISMDAENKKLYRTTLISHTYMADIAGQAIRVERQFDNYIPAEAFYYIALLGQTKSPDYVHANKKPLVAASDLAALAATTSDGFFFEPTQQIIFIKIFDQQPTLSLLLADLLPISRVVH